jgi:hypothetical protein
MKYILLILITSIVSTLIISCNNAADQKDVQDIVIVNGDTLGRNWDNLPSKEEAEQARELGLTPEQYMQMKDEQMKQDLLDRQQRDEILTQNQGSDNSVSSDDIPKSKFSDKMYQEPTYSVETQNGQEVIVGSNNPH